MRRKAYGGPAAVLGDYISTDKILPGRHLAARPEDLVLHVLDEVGAGVNALVRRSRTLVAGEGFGYGSGREAAARALRAAGIELLIGKSFGRLFYRNAINQGMLALECRELVERNVAAGDEVVFDAARHAVRWNGADFPVTAIPDIVLEIVDAGGLVEYGRLLHQRCAS